MDSEKFYFMVEDHEDSLLLGPYGVDMTYFEVLNDLQQKSNHFSPYNTIRYAVPGKAGTSAAIRSEADFKHMIILHQARGDTIILLKVTASLDGRPHSRLIFTLFIFAFDGLGNH